MLKSIIVLSYLFVFLFFVNSVQAITIFDSNDVKCSDYINVCDSNFNHPKFGNVTINENHELIFNGTWVRINYLTHSASEEINISTDIHAIEGAYEMSINTPASVYNSNYSARITFISGVAELWVYKMDPFGNNYSNLVDNSPREDVSIILGSIEKNKYYNFQTTYDGTDIKVYFDNELVFSKPISFENGHHNVSFMSRSSAPWKNLLIKNDIDTANNPTATNTPSPTPISTSTPTSIPVKEKQKIIVIPGAFASWNGGAILHKKNVDQKDWSILPFVNEYKGITQTLKNLDYEENKDLYIFAYDWRKPIKEIIKDLDTYIQQINTNNEKIKMIGHSLGGLVGRSYMQTYSDNKIEKLITLGSPHLGIAQAYKAVEAGDLEQDNTWLWLSQKIVLQLYRDGIKTDRQIMHDSFPIAYDLLPTFNYLKNNLGEEKDLSSMLTKNDYLINLNADISSISDKLKTVGGKGIDTISGYFITYRTPLDTLLGNYVDGRPSETINSDGDGLVLKSSAAVSASFKEFDLYNHGEIIYKKEAIKEILDSLNISYSDDQIIEGFGTAISPSLIFLIKSPATMRVKYGDKVYEEHDGIIFIENADDGNYKLLVKGREKGRYEVIIGEIGISGDSWGNIKGEISSVIPQLEIDEYDIEFNTKYPSSFFIDKNNPFKLIDELILSLTQNKKSNIEIIKDLTKVKEQYRKQKYNKIPDSLFDQNEDLIEKKEYLNLVKLEIIYSLLVQNDTKKAKKLNSKFDSLLKKFKEKQDSLLKSKKKVTNEKIIILEMIEKRFRSLLVSLNKAEYSYSEIMLETISNLIKKL